MSKGANLLTRIASKGVDFILVFAAMEALPRAGWLAGVLYILISDGLYDGQSIGKKLTGLKVVCIAGDAGNSRPADIKGSIMRNATFGLGLFFLKVPLVGWLLFIALAGFEFVTLMGSPEGRRFGDEIAGTRVEEADQNTDGRNDIV